MSSPSVSIVVNNYNYRAYLRQSVESALAQTHPGTEVVVVDDASTDGSQELIRSFGDRITAVLLERNGGQAAALNAGFAASRGERIVFLDADDYLYPDAAARAAAAFAPGVAIVQYRLDLVDAAGRRLGLYPAPEVSFDRGDVVPRLLATGRFEGTVTSGNAFARVGLAAVLPIPADQYRISADGYLLTTMPFQGAVAALDEALGAYRQHGANGWALQASGAGFRRLLRHDADKHRVLARCAAARGLPLAREPGLRDHQHLSARIGSLCLEPGEHPTPGDSRLALALRGALAASRARLRVGRRAALAAWFLCVGVLPRSFARRALAWRLDPASRPPAIRRALRAWRNAFGASTAGERSGRAPPSSAPLAPP